MENFGLFCFVLFFSILFIIIIYLFIYLFILGLIDVNLKNVNQLYFHNKIMGNYGNQLNLKYLIFQI